MKITFLALFCVVTGVLLITAALAFGPGNIDPVTRRQAPGRTGRRVPAGGKTARGCADTG
jgi:hypothetical protein